MSTCCLPHCGSVMSTKSTSGILQVHPLASCSGLRRDEGIWVEATRCRNQYGAIVNREREEELGRGSVLFKRVLSSGCPETPVLNHCPEGDGSSLSGIGPASWAASCHSCVTVLPYMTTFSLARDTGQRNPLKRSRMGH